MDKRSFRGHRDIQLVADVGGDPGAPAVLFSHGGGQTRASWGDAARALVAAGYHVISLDLRGHGESGWCPEGNYALEAYAEDLREVVAGLPMPPALVGASLGGLASLLAVGEGGVGAAALIMVDVTPRIDPGGAAKIAGFMRANPDGFASLEEAADAVSAYLPHRPRPRDLSGLRKNLRQGDDGRLYWHWDPGMLGTFRPDPTGMLDRFQAAAANVRVPTLLVRGSLSEIVTEDAAREFIDAIPGCEYVDVTGAGHMVAGDRNDVFNRSILEFLERHRPAG